jgi:hypothetical protein
MIDTGYRWGDVPIMMRKKVRPPISFYLTLDNVVIAKGFDSVYDVDSYLRRCAEVQGWTNMRKCQECANSSGGSKYCHDVTGEIYYCADLSWGIDCDQFEAKDNYDGNGGE